MVRLHFQLPPIFGFDLKYENQSMMALLENGPKSVECGGGGRACAD
jgi:hypothetical protein